MDRKWWVHPLLTNHCNMADFHYSFRGVTRLLSAESQTSSTWVKQCSIEYVFYSGRHCSMVTSCVCCIAGGGREPTALPEVRGLLSKKITICIIWPKKTSKRFEQIANIWYILFVFFNHQTYQWRWDQAPQTAPLRCNLRQADPDRPEATSWGKTQFKAASLERSVFVRVTAPIISFYVLDLFLLIFNLLRCFFCFVILCSVFFVFVSFLLFLLS